MNKMSIILSLAVIAVPLQAQDITNKLGGNTATETYDVTDSNDNLLFRIQGDGKVGIGTTSSSDKLSVDSDGATAIYGNQSLSTGSTHGVYGNTNAPTGAGVKGTAGPTGANFGGHFSAPAIDGTGVYGQGNKYGGYFSSTAMPAGVGLYSEGSAWAGQFVGPVYANGSFRLSGTFLDKDGDSGTSGQILSSTATGTNWITAPSAHNAVTIGTANGLSLSTQQISLSNATTSASGAMSVSDKTKLDGLSSSSGWSLTGNAGTTAGTNFIGTTDPVVFEIKVSGRRIMRYQPYSYETPNIIGGYLQNSVPSTVKGAFIGGGGSQSLGNKVTANYGSVICGYNNTASGWGSTVTGISSTASGRSSFTMGENSVSSGSYSAAMGYGSESSGSVSFALGTSNKASGDYSTALGWKTTASGESSTAMGSQTTASGNGSTAMGSSTTASGQSSTAMGENTIASGLASTAMSNYATASGDYSTAMGYKTTAVANYLTVVGKYNVDESDALFIVGNGTSSSKRNAFEVESDGDIRAGDDVFADDVKADDLWTEFGGTTSYKLVKYAVGMGVGSQVHASSSDRRLKENIQTISSPIERVQSLRGVTYGWNQTAKDYFMKDVRENVLPADSLSTAEKEAVWEEEEQKILDEADRHTMSFIAQEVEEVFPKWVIENEAGYKEINMKGLDGLLVEAVKELKAEKDNEIQELREEIAGLKSIITEILMIKD